MAQSYVIATKTRIDVSQVKLPETLTDDYFRRTKAEKKKKSEGAEIFEKSGKVGSNKKSCDFYNSCCA